MIVGGVKVSWVGTKRQRRRARERREDRVAEIKREQAKWWALHMTPLEKLPSEQREAAQAARADDSAAAKVLQDLAASLGL